MPDYAAIQITVAVVALLAVILIVRSIHIVQPGYLGLVFLFGVYKRAITPGFWVTALFVRVRVVKLGSGSRGVLGLVGVAETQLSIDGPIGSVKIDERSLPARATSVVSADSTVRVIEDEDRVPLLVAREYTRPGKSTTGTPPLSSSP